MNSQALEETEDVLQKGILIRTNKGLVCFSLTEALSSNLNLSMEDLKSITEQLILDEETNKKSTPPNNEHSLRFLTALSSDTTVDSDDPTSDCSGITIGLDALHQSFGGTVTSSILQTSGAGSVSTVELKDVCYNVSDLDTGGTLTPNTSTADDTPDDNFKVDVGKLVMKRRGGWPKGRKRKPELLHLPPKAPATGYNLYLNEMRKQFKDGPLPFHEITKIIGNRWSSLSLEQKKPYLERAEEDKRRYRDELRVYRQSGAYQLYLAKKRRKRMQNNVLSESDMDATDDIDDEDNEELYCRTCDQWFHNLHNKREHLQGRQHVQAVVGDMRIELGSEVSQKESGSAEGTGLLQSAAPNQGNDLTVAESIANLVSVVTKREKEIKTLKVRVEEANAAHEALYRQLSSLKERETTLKNELVILKNMEKKIEENLFQLWQLPSLFVTTELNSSYLETSEYLTE